jgi:hypothetical protein
MYKARFLPIGKAILHLFLLAFLFNLSIHFHTAININGLLSIIEKNESKLSQVSIIDGTLTKDSVEEIIISEQNQEIIISNSDSIKIENKNAIALLNNELLIKTKSQDFIIPYSMIGNGSINELIQRNRGMFYLGGVLFFVGSYLLQLTLLFIGVSILAAIVTKQKNTLQYRLMWRISAFAITNTILLFTLFNFLQIQLPSLVAFIILLISNLMVILSLRK